MAEHGVLVWLPGPHEPDVVAALGQEDGLVVTRRCADLAELLAAAAAGAGQIAVLALERGVDRTRIVPLARGGVLTVLVVGPEDLHRAGALGADVVVPDGTDVAASVAREVRSLVERAGLAPESSPWAWRPGADWDVDPGGERGGASEHDHDSGRESDAVRSGDGAARGAAAPRRAPHRPGRVLAVWSGAGAPGRTTIAAGLAAELVRLGQRTALVDADTVAPAMAQVLGVLEETAGLAALCRAAADGTLDPDTLRRRVRTMPDGVAFVSGLTRADRWREIAPEALEVVLGALRSRTDWNVVDVAAGPEAAPVRGADRHAATRSVLGVADVLLAVVPVDPVGVRRAVQALTDLPELDAPGELRIVVNATRPGPARSADAVADALVRFVGRAPSWNVPYDDAVGAALLAGGTLAQHAPRAPARRALAGIARALVAAGTTQGDGEPAPGGRRRAPWGRRRVSGPGLRD